MRCLAPGACRCPHFPSDLACFTLHEVVYFQLYKIISSSLSTVLGYTCNMMHFSSSLLNMWSCMFNFIQSYIKFAFNYTWLHKCNIMCFSSSLLSITFKDWMFYLVLPYHSFNCVLICLQTSDCTAYNAPGSTATVRHTKWWRRGVQRKSYTCARFWRYVNVIGYFQLQIIP